MNKELAYFLNIVPEDGNETIIPLDECIKEGIIFIDSNNQVIQKVSANIFNDLKKNIRYYNNNAFYSDYDSVENRNELELFVDKIMHYMSTYGRENFGLESQPYIISEKFGVKDSNIIPNKITIYKILSIKECQELFTDYVINSMRSFRDVMAQNYFINLVKEHMFIGNIEDVLSYEAKAILYDEYNKLPEDPQEFLRFIVYKATGKTLLIKNKETIDKIRYSHSSSDEKYYDYFIRYGEYEKLASIFFRYKPIFLAFKGKDGCSSIINKIRRLADKYHKPLNPVNVQNYHALNDEDKAKIRKKATNRELVKLINYYLSKDSNYYPVYNIRNGKMFINTVSKENKVFSNNDILLLYNELVARLKEAYEGYTIIIPKHIYYALPTSEKQMFGTIPWGTTFILTDENEANSVGIHWNNQPNSRVDLDLHIHDNKGGHYGWNSLYNGDVVYSGDMTDAPIDKGGATESFKIKKKEDTIFILSLNNFTFGFNQSPVEFDFFLSQGDKIFDASNMDIQPIKMSMDKQSSILGFYDYQNIFTIYGGRLDNYRVPNFTYAEYIESILKKSVSMLNIGNLIISKERLNIDFTYEIPENTDKVIDLRPESLNNETLLKFIDGKLLTSD